MNSKLHEIKIHGETYVKGDILTQKKIKLNRVLILFKATESQSGDRINFLNCLRLLEKVPSIKVSDQISYCSFKSRKNSKTRLENDPGYALEINQPYVKRINKTGKRDLVYEICAHFKIVDSSKIKSPSQIEIDS